MVLVAGPPFKTDDPQPVDYRHWEFYAASVQQFGRTEMAATAPHIEVNYGVVPAVQLHIVLPFEYVHANEGNAYGFSDLEVGIKYRFVNESESFPQIGIFPSGGFAARAITRVLWCSQSRGLQIFESIVTDVRGVVEAKQGSHPVDVAESIASKAMDAIPL